ncbi:lipoprotein [Paraliobacillus quinghaiensis]|uniref:Lipoprotein n=1 Tax=Paraliobacillus quinghaiensis TaxID=470815 RepID=A0A917WVB8_9BACI|nr:MetQ/NlpA family ABC transporter substrate-binding protein [Paraliobacillus quinghaiensis]GGM35768.1 lipoprotein [Paraliobacillus quinghaiensis]
MKKFITVLVLLSVGVILAACGNASGEDVIKVGATSTPHAEVLEEAKPLLEEEGITLEIETYQDYILPNQDLESGEIDANYFQHIPYFETEQEEKGYDFVNLGGIHVEPMGVYSKGIPSIDAIEEGTEVIMSRAVADHGRILSLFEAKGLIKLAEGVKKSEATIDDIVENPLDLEFKPDVNAEFLIETYRNEEDVLVAINTNYAIEADLSPVDDSLFVEGAASEYVNIIAARAEDKDDEKLNKLVEVLQSEEIQSFITEKYNGEVVAVGNSEE